MEEELARPAYSTYIKAKPFPHVVFDNFFDPDIVDRVLAEFPKPGAIRWQKFDSAEEIKLASAAEASFGPVTQLFMYHLNSYTFLDFIGKVTGIDNLIPDPRFEGGGLHQIVPGGKLGVHADFNRHRDYGLDRRLNLLLYLNKDWRQKYGGELQLWDRGMKLRGRSTADFQPRNDLRYDGLHLPWTSGSAAVPRRHDPKIPGAGSLQQWPSGRRSDGRALDLVSGARSEGFPADVQAAPAYIDR
jgi:hypothetical protein